MAVDMMVPLTSESWAPITVMNNTEYYSFHVNVYNDTITEPKRRLIIPSEQSVTRENLRQKLYDRFGIRKDSRISYIDDDGDDLPIDSECEFQEALRLAKTFVPTKGLTLVVRPSKLGEWNNGLDVEQYDETGKDVQNEKMIQSCTSDLNRVAHETTDIIDEANEKQPRVGLSSDKCFQAIDNLNTSTRWQSQNISHENTLPPPWFTEYMESMKKEMVSTITQEVMKQMTKVLNKHLDTFTSLLDKTNQARRHSSLSSKGHSRCSDSHLNERNQRRMIAQDEGQFSDASIERVDEPQDSNVNYRHWLYLHELDNIKGQIHELLKEKQHKRADEATQNLDTDVNNEHDRRESIQIVNDNNAQEDAQSPTCCMTSDALKVLDGELRMNCSITGNRVLDVDSLHEEDAWCDDIFMENIDKVSHCSGCSIAADEREHIDAFVMVEMPVSEKVDQSLVHPKTLSPTELRKDDNSRDSPSFELLSETPSPRSSSCIDEEHFVNIFAESDKTRTLTESPSPAISSSAFTVDVHGKIYNQHLPTATSVEFEKRSDGVYSFVAETLPGQKTDSFKSSRVEQSTSSERKSSRYNATTTSDNKRNQFPNLPRATDDQLSAETFYWKTHSQSQTDANDFMQSFHSHTTSVTDNNNDIFYQPHRSGAQRKTTAKEAQEGTTTPKAARYNNRDKRSDRVRADESCRDDSDKFSQPQQSSRTNGSAECSGGPRKTSEQVLNATTADPVLILPETLLTVAAQVGSIAYVTARDMFDKLRSHTKEDPVKRRRVKLRTSTDSCSSSSSTTCRSANQSQ